jgi:hypothetical protein
LIDPPLSTSGRLLAFCFGFRLSAAIDHKHGPRSGGRLGQAFGLRCFVAGTRLGVDRVEQFDPEPASIGREPDSRPDREDALAELAVCADVDQGAAFARAPDRLAREDRAQALGGLLRELDLDRHPGATGAIDQVEAMARRVAPATISPA